MSHTDRAEAMARRLWRSAQRAGIRPDAIVLAFQDAMQRRTRVLGDPRHPDFLHPGRTALILIDDLGVDDVPEIVAAVLYDSLDPRMTAAADSVADLAGAEARVIFSDLAALGRSEASLAEDLVTGSAPLRRAALAERLDHARHLHLRDRSCWDSFHGGIRTTYLPLAERTHPVLFRRFRWWTSMFARKYLGP